MLCVRFFVGAGARHAGLHFPDKKDLPRIAILGLTGMFGNQFFFILGLDWTNSTIASAVNQFQPIAASCMAIIIGLERFIWLKLLGVVVCVVGALLMIGLGNLQAGGEIVVCVSCIAHKGHACESVSVYHACVSCLGCRCEAVVEFFFFL